MSASLPAESTPTSADGRARVILVGRTGLDGALRRDPSIELRRAKTPLDAIGELADPDFRAADPGASVAVIVAADADLGEHAAAFIDGLRLINPGVRVLLCGEETREPYHGAVVGDDVADQIHALFAPAPSPAPRAPQSPAPQARVAGAFVPAPMASTPVFVTPRAVVVPPLLHDGAVPAHDGVAPAPIPLPPGVSLDDDIALLEWLMAGRDLLLPAMQLVRQRTGSPDVIFVPAEADGALPGASAAASPMAASAPASTPASPLPPTVASPTPDTAQVAVNYRSRCLGWLSSRRVGMHALAPHAAWLAHWITLRDQQDQLRRAAFTDDLTGASNRRYFDRFLAAAIDQARAERHPVTVLFFDIDDFKKYNDRYGHGAGDEILRETVRLLKSVIRPTDRVCRIGGDEFAVIFHEPQGPREPSSKPPGAILDIAHRFQRQICEHRFPKLGEQAPGTLTISGGLATFPWDGDTPEKLLERADELAIQSKRLGKNAITLGPGAERVCTPA